jgi:hypothetical protein
MLCCLVGLRPSTTAQRGLHSIPFPIVGGVGDDDTKIGS